MHAVLDRFRSLGRRLTDTETRRFQRSVKAYKREKARSVVTEFPQLTASSVAFDLGGYQGEWTDEIFARYGCEVHVFEAHPRFAADLAARFAGNPKIHVHPFALASTDGSFDLSNEQDASSACKAGKDAVECRMVAVDRFIADHRIAAIDVIKINIEGGEYDILPALVSGEHLENIGTLLVQFHHFDAGDPTRRDEILKSFSRTHVCDWCYDFVWEQWSRKPPARR